MESIINKIKKECPNLKLLENEPMSRHCSFRIGGPVRAMALPESEEELAAICAALRERGEKPLIIGNGTNLLVTDAPLNRLVIKTEKLCRFKAEEDRVTAQCGASLARLAVLAQQNGLTGLEFAHGIPGSLGGAVSMNAGAYGGEMKNFVVSTTFLDEDLKLRMITGDEHDFSYRHSVFSDTDCVIIGNSLKLSAGDSGEIRARMEELAEKRKTSQPLDKPSAGSTFKRPQAGYAAAMIDEAGLKGFSIGGAAVSEKHAGFVVNLGGACFKDVRLVIEHVQETVYKETGVRLEPEVKIITA